MIAFLLGTTLFIVGAILEGWVLTVMWGWFIVPAFGIAALRIPHAIGLALVVGMLTHRVRKPENTPETPFFLAMSLITPLIFLAIGSVVKAFI